MNREDGWEERARIALLWFQELAERTALPEQHFSTVPPDTEGE